MADSISQVDLINAAGALVGEEPITSLTDDSKLARQGKALFKPARNECFDMRVDWRFATARQTLAYMEDEPLHGTYDYMYELPTNCRRIQRLHESTDDDTEYPFRRETYDNKNVILANVSTAYIEYTLLITDTNRWPAYFAKLVYTRLALLLCGPLRQDKQKVQQIRQMYEEALMEAKAGNGAEDQDVTDEDERIDLGNTDVIDAATQESVDKNYIQVRTSNS